jgi:hypothetical protein
MLGLEGSNLLRRRRPQIGQIDFAQEVGTHISDCEEPAVLARRDRDDRNAAIGSGEGIRDRFSILWKHQAG